MKKNILLASVLLLSLQLEAKPQLEKIAHGKAVCQEQGKELIIQASDQAILNFHSFDVHRDEAVRFRMEDPSHRVLNRIHSSHPSQIDGQLTSNGIVYLLNPAGVVFGPHSIVDVASLVVAAAHLSDEDFIQGRDNFRLMEGTVEALGKIFANEVTLAGAKVLQHGKVEADTVLYSVGDHLYLGKGGEHLFVKCDKDKIKDDACFIACGTAESFLIHHSGVTKADSIHLYGEKGSTTKIDGTLDASGDGMGGKIVVQGETVQLENGHLDASGKFGGGTILVGGGQEGEGVFPASLEVNCDHASTLIADAIFKGDGGTIVQWADERSKANGFYSVRGGREGGNGGEIETSSGNLFQGLTTRTETSAPQGIPGSWKIDPYSIQIQDVGGSATLADIADGTNNMYVINTATINAAPAGTVLFNATNSSTHTPGTCSIALGTPGTPANINTVNAGVTLIFNTTESPTVRGMMTTNGTIQSDTIVFSTPITLTGNTSVTASNAITLVFDTNGDGNGPWNLSLTAPASVIAQGSIGNTTPIGGTFTVATTVTNSGTFLVGNLALAPTCTIHSVGNMSIGAAVSLQAPSSFLSDMGGMTFNGPINASTTTSQENLTLSAVGDIIFNDTLGLNTLGDILIQNAHDVHLKVSPAALSNGIPPHFIRGRSFTQLNGTGDSLFEGSIYTSGVPIITRNNPQNGGPVSISTTGNINFYYLVNSGGFPSPVLSYTLPTRPYYKSVINTTGARAIAPGSGFSGGNVTLTGSSINLLGVYAGGTPAFPGSTSAGGKGGDVAITTTMGLNLRGPIFATGGAGANGGGQVLPTLLFSGQNLNASGSDSPGNIVITGPVSLGFNGVVLRGQNIQAASVTGLTPDLLALDGSTNGSAQVGPLANLSYFVVDYSKGVVVNGATQAEGVALFNSGSDGIVFKGPVTAQNITAIKNQFVVTFEQGYTAPEVALLNCSGTPPVPPVPPVVSASNNLGLAGVYAPSSGLVGNISFDTPTSLFSILNLLSETPFADIMNLGMFFINDLMLSELTEDDLKSLHN